jgi:hypothetical protein
MSMINYVHDPLTPMIMGPVCSPAVDLEAKIISADMINEMRMWIMDCVWDDLDADDVDDLADAVIIRGVQRHYDGGVDQFVQDQEPVDLVVARRAARVAELLAACPADTAL